MRSRAVTVAIFVPILAFVLLQLVPYGRDRSAPSYGTPVAWDSPKTRGLAERACFDCHSNQTEWPWYASIAPVSWLIQSHVEEGREALNFSAFEPGQEGVAEAAGEASESVAKGEMPPRDYLLMHPEARLTASERRALVAGLDATFASFAEREGSGERSEAGEESSN